MLTNKPTNDYKYEQLFFNRCTASPGLWSIWSVNNFAEAPFHRNNLVIYIKCCTEYELYAAWISMACVVTQAVGCYVFVSGVRWHRKLSTYQVISWSCMANRCQWQRCNVGWFIHVGFHKLSFYYVFAFKTNIVDNGLQIPHVLKQQEASILFKCISKLSAILPVPQERKPHYWLKETSGIMMIGELMSIICLIACGINSSLSQSPPSVLFHCWS